MQALNEGNPWIVSAAQARRHIPAVPALLIACGLFALTLRSAPLLYTFASGLTAAHLSLGSERLLRSLCYFLPLNAPAFLLFVVYEGRKWPRAGRTFFAFGGWSGAIAFMLALFAVYALGVVRFIGPGAISAPALAGIAEGALIIGLRTFGEEYFFRAWLQPLVARSWGAPAAIAATSLLFGLLHLVSRNVPLVALVNISLAGAFFGLLAMRTGGLAAPFAAHWMWNAFEQCVFGLTPNPGVDRLGSLVDLDLVGPTLYSGGGDGLNGSLGTTAALLICVAALSLGWRVAVGHGSVAEAGHR